MVQMAWLLETCKDRHFYEIFKLPKNGPFSRVLKTFFSKFSNLQTGKRYRLQDNLQLPQISELYMIRKEHQISLAIEELSEL